MEKGIFTRAKLLFGSEKMKLIGNARVIIFGIGGVGSWCAESLVRSGIHNLTIVDSDTICITNVNRQLHATTLTIGEVKAEVLKKRLLEINPKANILAIREFYSAENRDLFELEKYDYIIDAIDSPNSKADLIISATKCKATFFSSMGAARKIDPTKIQVAEFWKVKGDPLASSMRRKIRKGEMPSKKFQCVYSEEVLENKEYDNLNGTTNGSVVHITAIFGFTLAGLVIQDINKKDYL